MKKLFYISISLIIVSFVIGPTTLYSQEEIAATDEAKRVLEQYFYSMKNGNTSQILNLITGPLLKKRERLLKYNTQYGNFLRERYKNANLFITSMGFTHNNKLSLKASIVFDDQQKLDLIFTFSEEGSDGNLKIYSKEKIP